MPNLNIEGNFDIGNSVFDVFAYDLSYRNSVPGYHFAFIIVRYLHQKRIAAVGVFIAPQFKILRHGNRVWPFGVKRALENFILHLFWEKEIGGERGFPFNAYFGVQVGKAAIIPTGEYGIKPAIALFIRYLVAPQPGFAKRFFLLIIRVVSVIIALPYIYYSAGDGFAVAIFHLKKVSNGQSFFMLCDAGAVQLFVFIVGPFGYGRSYRVAAVGYNGNLF
jgi:hypothetical protein